MEIKMKIFENMGIDAGYLILGIMAVQLILLILYIVLFLQHIKMKKNYPLTVESLTALPVSGAVTEDFEGDALT